MTSKISLFYNLTQKEIAPPAPAELERKDEWIKAMQKRVEAEWKPVIVKVEYSVFNPKIENQRKFFEGAVIVYYAIQNSDITDGIPSVEILKQFREMILDEMLGYDYQAVNRIIRKRDSTTDFKTVAKWNEFLNTLKETLFDGAGYEFPDSEEFWKLEAKFGYEEAKKISIGRLQKKLKAKYAV